MIKLGFSTGALYKVIPEEKKRLAVLKNAGFRYVESCMVHGKPEEIKAITLQDVGTFEYVSLHAPVIRYGNNPKTRQIFNAIKNLHDRVFLNSVVFHPDTVLDFSVFHDFAERNSFKVCFENMDDRKKTHRGVASMVELMKKHPNYSMVLDLNHAFSNDVTQALTAQFYRKLRSRISQLHLSGYDCGHAALFKTRQAQIVENAAPVFNFNLDIPIIVESVLSDLKELGMERDYILDILACHAPSAPR